MKPSVARIELHNSSVLLNETAIARDSVARASYNGFEEIDDSDDSVIERYHPMTTMNATAVLDRHFLELRCEILNLAAALDRIERADGASNVGSDPRLAQLRRGLEILTSGGANRAEQVQMLFSEEYQPGWNE